MTREDLLTRTFVELADNLVADFDVIDFLTSLAGHCVELLAVDSVGILLADAQDKQQFAAASSEDAELLELFSLQVDEGPCLDSYRRGEPVVNQDLASSDTPWPRFATAAVDAGYRSVHALPLRLRDRVLGSMNLFGADPRPLPAGDLLVAQAMADVATISLIQDRVTRDNQVVIDHLGEALNSRVLIEQAKGMLAEHDQIDMDEAFTRLRIYSRGHNRRLRSVAADVIDRSLTPQDLRRQPQEP